MEEVNELALTKEQAQAIAAYKSRERQELDDLAELAAHDSFARFLRGHIAGLGMGRQLGTEDLARYNLGVALVRKVARVNPRAARDILAHCFGVE